MSDKDRYTVTVVGGVPEDLTNELGIEDVDERLQHILVNWFGYEFDGEAFLVEHDERDLFEKRIDSLVKSASGSVDVDIELLNTDTNQ